VEFKQKKRVPWSWSSYRKCHITKTYSNEWLSQLD